MRYTLEELDRLVDSIITIGKLTQRDRMVMIKFARHIVDHRELDMVLPFYEAIQKIAPDILKDEMNSSKTYIARILLKKGKKQSFKKFVIDNLVWIPFETEIETDDNYYIKTFTYGSSFRLVLYTQLKIGRRFSEDEDRVILKKLTALRDRDLLIKYIIHKIITTSGNALSRILISLKDMRNPELIRLSLHASKQPELLCRHIGAILRMHLQIWVDDPTKYEDYVRKVIKILLEFAKEHDCAISNSFILPEIVKQSKYVLKIVHELGLKIDIIDIKSEIFTDPRNEDILVLYADLIKKSYANGTVIKFPLAKIISTIIQAHGADAYTYYAIKRITLFLHGLRRELHDPEYGLLESTAPARLENDRLYVNLFSMLDNKNPIRRGMSKMPVSKIITQKILYILLPFIYKAYGGQGFPGIYSQSVNDIEGHVNIDECMLPMFQLLQYPISIPISNLMTRNNEPKILLYAIIHALVIYCDMNNHIEWMHYPSWQADLIQTADGRFEFEKIPSAEPMYIYWRDFLPQPVRMRHDRLLMTMQKESSRIPDVIWGRILREDLSKYIRDVIHRLIGMLTSTPEIKKSALQIIEDKYNDQINDNKCLQYVIQHIIDSK